MNALNLPEKKLNEKTSMELYPCLSGEDVINNGAKYLVQQIKNLVSVPNEIFQKIYLSPIYRLAEICQAMPFRRGEADYSLLIKQLNICIAALKFRQKFLLPPQEEIEVISEQEAQWTYAIFSASLVYQLYKIEEDRIITVHRKDGTRNIWDIISGSLYKQNASYSIEWKNSTKSNPALKIMNTISAELFPQKIITWLMQNTILFPWWHDVMTLRENKNNIINKMLEDAVTAVDANVMEFKDQPNDQEESSDNRIDHILKFINIKYLNNNSDLYWLRVKEGLFVEIKTLDNYFKEHGGIYKSLDELVENIRKYFFAKNKRIHFIYRPKIYEDRRIIEGLIIAKEFLGEVWKEQPIDTKFQLAIL